MLFRSKNYKETSDYKQWIQFTTPIPKISRLTVRWVDHQGQLIDFQSFDNNAFTLRFHCEYQKVPEPVAPLQDTEIKRIVEAMTFKIPEVKEQAAPRQKIHWWVIVAVIVFLVFVWKTYGSRPAVPVPQAPVKTVALRPGGQ